jgi:membrane peptidoglycan carboxypeptidase
VGFTPHLATAVWIGSPDDNEEVRIGGRGITGGSFPAEIWGRYMRAWHEGREVLDFPDPAPTRSGRYLSLDRTIDAGGGSRSTGSSTRRRRTTTTIESGTDGSTDGSDTGGTDGTTGGTDGTTDGTTDGGTTDGGTTDGGTTDGGTTDGGTGGGTGGGNGGGNDTDGPVPTVAPP